MPRQADPGGQQFTFDPQKGIVPVYKDASGNVIDPAAVAKSIADNPQASKGGYEGSEPMGAPPTGSAGNVPGGDYGSYLGVYNLPADVQAKVNEIFQNTPDVSQATALAMAYIRGTSWYGEHYHGIQEGIARGVISNEADYRAYMNQANLLTHQYLGRDISSDEMSNFLSQGYDLTRVGRVYQGAAIVNTNSADWNQVAGAFDTEGGAFTDAEKTALGQEQAGIDSELGQKIQRRLQLAQQRLQTVFRGQLATPGLTSTSGRLQSTTLGGQQNNDVSA